MDRTPTLDAWPAELPPAPPTEAVVRPTPAPGRANENGRRWARVALVMIAVIAVVAAAFFAGTRIGARDTTTAAPEEEQTSAAPTTERPTASAGPSTTRPRAPRVPGAPGASGAIDDEVVRAEVAELQAFVERERGLAFKEPVDVEALPAAAFRDRVLEAFESEADALERQGRLLQAMGLVPPDLDVVEAQRELLGSGVLGFYDPATDVLVVRGDEVGPFFREIVVHELTHALDDQHFDLDRPEYADRNDGSEWAFLALVEGNARRVEYAYVEQLSAADQDELQSAQLELGLEQMGSLFDLPFVLPQLLMAPYDYGAPFVDALLNSDGQEGLDRAFGEPPATSEQILAPERYRDREGARPVDRPPADGEVIDEGVLGELMTGFLVSGGTDLQDLLDGMLSGDLGALEDLAGALDGTNPEDLNLDELLGAAGQLGMPRIETIDGWGGDRYVLWEAPRGGVCMRVDWVMDTASARAALDAALRTWSAEDGRASIEQPAPDVVRLTRCTS